MKKLDSEYQLMVMISDWMSIHYPDVLWRYDMGGIKTSIGVAVKCKRINHASKGWPDIFIAKPKEIIEEYGDSGPVIKIEYCGLFIEVKTIEGEPFLQTQRGHPSKEQIEKIESLNNAGYHARILYGFKAITDEIRSYLGE